MALIELIGAIRHRLKEGAYPNETAVREAIVSPVLRELGWDTTDPSQVWPEYALKTRRVDYALCIEKRPQVIIEVKAVGKIEADQQLFEYAFHAGAPFAILTDGGEWRVYLPGVMGVGGHAERLVRSLNIAEHDSDVVVKGLHRYLARNAVHTGSALKDAQADLENRINRGKASQAIPEAWDRLCEEADDDLVGLLVNKTAQDAGGFAPDKDDVVTFLRGLAPSATRMQTQTRTQSPPLPKADARPPRPKPTTSEEISYVLLGERHTAKKALDAYINIICTLAKRDPEFLKKLEPSFVGTKNKNMARSREEISENQEARHLAREILPGWWLNIKLGNKRKKTLLKRACKVAKIKFGSKSGLKINLPNS